MAPIFCCSSLKPYLPKRLDHEHKFNQFMQWANLPSMHPGDGSSLVSSAPYAVQLVRQINYGPQESIRFFVPASNGPDFLEATESDLLKANFEKLNSYKNFRCEQHNKFFEVNLDIDLAFRQKEATMELSQANKATKPTLRRESISSDSQRNASDLKRRCPLLPADQVTKVTDGDHEKRSLVEMLAGCSSRLSVLIPILRLLLQKVGTNLGASRLLSLLSLDWANEELDLDLDFEDHWEVEMTSSNVATFFSDCFDLSDGDSVDHAEIENLVILAMRHIEPLEKQKVRGRVRLQNIANRVLESDGAVNWASKYGADIRGVFASGPNEQLLDRCRRRTDKLQQDCISRNTKEDLTAQSLEVDPWADDYDDDEGAYGSDNFDYEQPMGDFTACDKECGYCGKCDY
ncbi:uncharacterized protein BCR38DRAFT_460639 [Pseudomassariella vexata]|uniref:Uncharacterized protein n=1 Tax=Pseudomassariella vexata TaxID=1141098 RepID=A0A1Y2DIW3_9PEZI|nr:uncharacterized protein BCR38DRAFT_460639 [Pseudomassariella vexata]ORY58765.1 hypothetical protein BCR38DRAFT_460639 [Pseudomassariella vexata]